MKGIFMKKILSAVLCLVLLLGFTSCTKPDVVPDDEKTSAEISETEKELPPELPENIEAPEKEIPKAPEVVYTSADSTAVMTVGEKPITEAMLRYYLLNYAKQYGGNNKKFWEEQAISSIKKYVAIEVLADKLGISMNDEQKEYVQYLIDYTVDMYNSKEDSSYEQALAELYLTDALNRTMTESGVRANVLYNEYINEGGIMWGATDEKILSYVAGEYARIKHVLIKTVDLDDAQKAEARKRAEKVYELALSGTDFEQLISQYSEDTMDIEAGYYIAQNDENNVQELENKAFELEIGEISDIVESAYGYHIIKKYAHDSDFVLSDKELRTEALSSICEKAYSTDIEINAQSLKVSYFDTYNEAKNRIFAELEE